MTKTPLQRMKEAAENDPESEQAQYRDLVGFMWARLGREDREAVWYAFIGKSWNEEEDGPIS